MQVENVEAEGSIGGVVLDAATRLPIPDVLVSVLAGRHEWAGIATNEEGRFALSGVPAGEVLVTLGAPEGYESTWLRGTLPSAAGDYPSGNSVLTLGPIGLLSVTGTFRFRIIDSGGEPVSGYQVSVHTPVRHVDLASGLPDAQGEVVRMVTTDGTGYAVADRIADYAALGPSVTDALVVILPPRDGDGDGVLEFGGGERLFHLRALSDPTPDIVLEEGPEASLQIRASTIGQLADAGAAAAVVATDAPIYVTFNLPIEPGATVTLADELGELVGGAPSVAVRDDTMEITFAPGALSAGAEYNLVVQAVSEVGGRIANGTFAAPFFTPSATDTVTVVAASRERDSQRVDLTLSQPIGGIEGALSGDDACVLFFFVDLDGAGGIGNAANEYGSDGCNVSLGRNETDPPGTVGVSGYTSYWTFQAPRDVNGDSLATDVPVHMILSRVADPSKVVHLPSGKPVADMQFTLPPESD